MRGRHRQCFPPLVGVTIQTLRAEVFRSAVAALDSTEHADLGGP